MLCCVYMEEEDMLCCVDIVSLEEDTTFRVDISQKEGRTVNEPKRIDGTDTGNGLIEDDIVGVSKMNKHGGYRASSLENEEVEVGHVRDIMLTEIEAMRVTQTKEMISLKS